MLKNKLLLIIFFLPLSLCAQTLILTPNGFRNSKNMDKDYVVIEVKGKTAKELYSNAINYIERTYKSPKDVIKGTVENEFLSFDSYSSDIAKMSNMFSWKKLNATYSIRLSFKDNKVKFEIISLNMYTYMAGDRIPVALRMNNSVGWGIYRKNGKFYMKKMKVTKTEIENFFNSFIKALKVGLINGGKSDDW